MGVGLDLIGRQVRCPHCRQVVTVPTAGPPKPPADTPPDRRTATPPEAEPPSTDGDLPLPNFAPTGRREGAESIFGDSEHEDDSVFAAPSAPPKPLLPDLPSSADLPGPQASGAIDFNPAAAEHQLPATDVVAAGDIRTPILGPDTPFIPKELSQPDFALLAKPPSHGPTPAVVPVPLIEPPAARPKPPTPRAGRGVLFWALVGYAAVVTVAAAWGWTRSKAPHPLSLIPDLFGQYRNADPKKVSALPVDATQQLPPELRVKLGDKLTLGELEFEPLAVEDRRVKWETKGDGGRPRDVDCLVLKARVRNLSKAHAFCPMDPAFNRLPTADAPPPLSAVIVGTERFVGGPIPWPFPPGVREYVTGQDQDDVPLEPGKDRTTVVPSADGERGAKLRDAVRAAKGVVLWQVHVRRGFVPFEGQDVSVGAVVGVEFTATQVKRIGERGA